MIISGSVGRGGVNRAEDVRLVQRLLNDARAREKIQLLKVDGLVGPKTNGAIEQYQRRFGLATDGRIDPRGPTLQHLLNAHFASLQAGVRQPKYAPFDRTLSIDHGDVLAEVVNEYLASLKS